MIFSEIHGVYYRAVAAVLRAASQSPVSPADLRRIVKTEAFSESVHTIESALRCGRWQLLCPDGTTPIKHAPTLPYTTLELRWLKAVSLDPRVRLFDFDASGLDGIVPLFTPDDIFVFDKYKDGDPYGDEGYISRFHTITSAIKERRMLRLELNNKTGRHVSYTAFPIGIEYSEKDDKFRLLTVRVRGDSRRRGYVNLGRLVSVVPIEGGAGAPAPPEPRDEIETLVLVVTDGRQTLDRALLHFAHFEKEAEKLEGNRFLLRLRYDKRDETELLIRVLSFGPFLRVAAPDSFVSLIKDRLKEQKDSLID